MRKRPLAAIPVRDRSPVIAQLSKAIEEVRTTCALQVAAAGEALKNGGWMLQMRRADLKGKWEPKELLKRDLDRERAYLFKEDFRQSELHPPFGYEDPQKALDVRAL